MEKYIKLFEEFRNSINEGQIQVYPAGNPYTPLKSIYVAGRSHSNGLQWPAFYKAAEEWLKDGYAITVITADFIPDHAAELGYNKKTTNTKYQSEINGTWKDKSLPLFMEDHPNYNETEFDLIKVDESLKNRDGVYIQDKDGNEFCIHPSRIFEVQLGSSVRDGIAAGSFYLINSMRARISNYQNGIVTLCFKVGSKDPKDYLEFTLDEWKKKHFVPIDESEHAESYKELEESECIIKDFSSFVDESRKK